MGTDLVIERLYRQVFEDRAVDPEENRELISTLQDLTRIKSGSNVLLTPDKLIWLRAAAFRISGEFLLGDRGENVKLLKAVNAVVRALETTLLLPSLESRGGDEFTTGAAEDLIRSIYGGSDFEEDEEGPVVTTAEAQALKDFLTNSSTRPPLNQLVWLRSTAFRVGSEFLDEGNDKDRNILLLKSINVVVHYIETYCMKPKPLEISLPPTHMPTSDTDLETAVRTLWNLDSNRLEPHKDYKIDVQNSKHPSNKDDSADDPLFTYVNRQVFHRPTYKAFHALLDNYSSYTGEEETVTRKELAENDAFLNAVMETAPMKYCHQFALAKSAEYKGDPVPEDDKSFKKVLNSIWFELYSRSGGGRRRKMDSSGFEHVFVGEVKNGKISGFHNWIKFYIEERKGAIDYRGYIKPRSKRSSAETNDDDHVLTLQFKWNGVEKFVGSFFIGVSPEFELALYTLAFLTFAGEKENIFVLDTGNESFELDLKCHDYDRGTKVGSCYVEALAHYD